RQPGSLAFSPLTSFVLPAGELVTSIAPPVVLPSGEAVIAYMTVSGASTYKVRALDLGPSDVAATAIPGTGARGALDTLPQPGGGGSAFINLGRAVVDSEGRAYVAWSSQVTGYSPASDSQSARAAVRPAAGSFGAAITLGSQLSGTLGTGIAVGVPSLGAGP